MWVATHWKSLDPRFLIRCTFWIDIKVLMSFVILAWNCKKFFIILSPGHLGEDGSIQENNRKVGKITNVNSDFMMVNSLENAKWCWRCCQLSIPFNVNSHVNPINAMQWRLENEKLTLEQLLKDLEGKLEEQGQTFQAQVILNFNYPRRKK